MVVREGLPHAVLTNLAAGLLVPFSVVANCQYGERATGGGYRVVAPTDSMATEDLVVNAPEQTSGTPTGWRVTGQLEALTTTTYGTTVRAYVICASP